MTLQETIDQNLRMLIGDMHIQLLLARAENAELRQQLEAMAPKVEQPAPPPTGNGLDHTPPPDEPKVTAP